MVNLTEGNNSSATAGNIQRYIDNWGSITNNSFILRIVKDGYKIQFSTSPPLNSPIISNPSQLKIDILRTQINRHLRSGAISKIPKSNDQYVSRVFTVKKSNNDDRMIIDLSLLNTFIHKVHFRMEDHSNIKSLLSSYDHMSSIDLSDAFFTIPLHNESKRYVVFEFQNIRYCYNVLPFGLTSSPRIFTKLLQVPMKHLRVQGINISSYLDDIFICNSDRNVLLQHVSTVVNTLSWLGFSINHKKSNLIPSQNLVHLGYIWDTPSMTLSVPEVKITKTKNLAKNLLNKIPTFREISSFLGLVVNHTNAFPHAPLYYRYLQFQFCQAIKEATSWDDCMPLCKDSLTNLHWWKNCPATLPPTSLLSTSPSISLSTDASNSGWGGYLSSGLTVAGSWSKEESIYHINFLELLAIKFCILSFKNQLKDRSIRILSDNITAVFYIKKIGGTHSLQMCELAMDIWKYLIEYNICINIVHIPGEQNTLADLQSRSLHDNNDYSLNTDIFKKLLLKIPFTPKVDLFASRLTNKTPIYVSWRFDPFAWKVNAFSFNWPNEIYLFPPINLISKSVQKFIDDEVEMGILITPDWPSLTVLPKILTLLFSDPVFIPTCYFEGQRPTRHAFNLMAWPISTLAAKTKAYLKRQQMPSWKAFPLPHGLHTNFIGSNFVHMLKKKGLNVELVFP